MFDRDDVLETQPCDGLAQFRLGIAIADDLEPRVPAHGVELREGLQEDVLALLVGETADIHESDAVRLERRLYRSQIELPDGVGDPVVGRAAGEFGLEGRQLFGGNAEHA